MAKITITTRAGKEAEEMYHLYTASGSVKL